MSVSRLGMALALSLLWAASVDAQAARIGYVDSNAVLAEYAPAQEARQQLESARQDAEAELQLLSNGWQAAVAEYEQQALQQRTQELEVQFQQRQAELLQPVMDRVTAVIEELRVEGNFAMILDRASQVILAADPALELTQEVLARLQAQDTGGG